MEAKEAADKNTARANFYLAVARWDAGEARAANNLLWKIPPQYRDFAWRFARSIFRGSDVVVYRRMHGTPMDLVVDRQEKRLAVVSAAIYLVDPQTGEELQTIEIPAEAACFGDSPDTLYCASKYSVLEVDLESGARRKILTLPTKARDIQLLAGGILTILDRQGAVQAFDLKAGQPLWLKPGATDASHNLAVSDSAGLAAWMTNDGRLSVFEGRTGKLVWQAEANQSGNLAFNPSGTRLIQAGAWRAGMDIIRSYEARTGKIVWEHEAVGKVCSSLAISSDGKTAAVGMGNGLSEGPIWIVELESGKKLHEFHGHEETARLVCFGPRGRRLYSVGHDDTLRFWDAKYFTTARVMPTRGSALDLAFARDGQQLLTLTPSVCSRWDALTDRRVDQFPTQKSGERMLNDAAYGHDVFAVATSRGIEIRDMATSSRRFVLAADLAERFRSFEVGPDGTQLAAAYDDAVRVWSLSSPREPKVFDAFQGPIAWLSHHQLVARQGSHAVCMNVETNREIWRRPHQRVLATSTDGRAAVAVIRKNILSILDGATGVVTRTIESPHHFDAADFSPDGSTLATVDSSHRLRLWSVATGEELISYHFKTEKYMLPSVAFSPRGDQLAVAANLAKAFFVFDVPFEGPSCRLVGHTERVSFASFSPDGKLIYTEAGDEQFVWNASTGERILDAVWNANKNRRIVSHGPRWLLYRDRRIDIFGQGYEATPREHGYRWSKHDYLRGQ